MSNKRTLDVERKIKIGLMYGIMAWVVMFPLLALNYIFWGRMDFIWSMTYIDIAYFGLNTLAIGLLVYMLRLPKYWTVFVSGILRWIFVSMLFLIVYPTYVIELQTWLFVMELPIMIFSYGFGWWMAEKIRKDFNL